MRCACEEGLAEHAPSSHSSASSACGTIGTAQTSTIGRTSARGSVCCVFARVSVYVLVSRIRMTACYFTSTHWYRSALSTPKTSPEPSPERPAGATLDSNAPWPERPTAAALDPNTRGYQSQPRYGGGSSGGTRHRGAPYRTKLSAEDVTFIKSANGHGKESSALQRRQLLSPPFHCQRRCIVYQLEVFGVLVCSFPLSHAEQHVYDIVVSRLCLPRHRLPCALLWQSFHFLQFGFLG